MIQSGEKVYITGKSYRCTIEEVIRRCQKKDLLNTAKINTEQGVFNAIIGYITRSRIGRKGDTIYTIDYTRNSHSGDFYLRQDFFTKSECYEFSNSKDHLPKELFEI